MTGTYSIPETNLGSFMAEVDKLNKRCRKIGIPEIQVSREFAFNKVGVNVLTVDGHINKIWWTEAQWSEWEAGKKEWPHFRNGEVLPYYTVTVEGQEPKIAGWSFIGTLSPIDLDGEKVNLVKGIPGESIPEKYRKMVGHCDHCNVRRMRNETFVCRHESGDHKSIGRQCIKDFLGYNGDPHELAVQAEILARLQGIGEQAEEHDGFGSSGGYRAPVWDLTHFLALTAARVDTAGWVSKKMAMESDWIKEPTVSKVLYILTPPNAYTSKEDREDWKRLVAATVVTEKHEVEAAAAIEWASTGLESDNDYLYNLAVIARHGLVTGRTSGLAASIIAAYRREQDRINGIEREKKAPRPVSNWVGKEKERLRGIKVTCEKRFVTEGQFGSTGIHKFVDENGNRFTWFASGSAAWIDEGATVVIDGTVKKHDEWKSIKETHLTRVTVKG